MSDELPAQMPDNSETLVDPRAEFRQLMGQFATGVCVVALEYGEDKIAAMTVNSFVSVSLEPRLICWSLQNSATQYEIFAKAERFSVSILAENQEALARQYAARGGALLDSSDFVRGSAGTPVVANALGYLECSKWSEMAAGDHTMLFGEVIGIDRISTNANVDGAALKPLGFFNGQFCAIQP